VFLLEYCGLPGLVRGVGGGAGMKVFSLDLKRFTTVCQSRVAGNKIKFGYGSEQILEDRADCWQLAVRRVRIDVVRSMVKMPGVEYPFELARPDEPRCPVCYEDLSGNVVSCLSRHQTCLKCFNLLPLKKCPMCNTKNYTDQELDKVKLMNGTEKLDEPHFMISVPSANSKKSFAYAEALFLGMLKRVYFQSAYGSLDNTFRTMILSSFYNWYVDYPDVFMGSNFNITEYYDDNTRYFDPNEPHPTASAFYLYAADAHLPKVYRDVAYTDIDIAPYRDDQFNIDLESFEGVNAWNRVKSFPGPMKEILKREIFFRTKIRSMTTEQISNSIIDGFKNILRYAHSFPSTFNLVKMEKVEGLGPSAT
jgi:hypothetical protein